MSSAVSTASRSAKARTAQCWIRVLLAGVAALLVERQFSFSVSDDPEDDGYAT